MSIELIHGEAIEEMSKLPDNSIDAVICDPPYGTTACKWDTIIPFEPMWEQLKRVTKKNGAIVLFSKQPFTSNLIMSCPQSFKQSLVWMKDNFDNPMQAKRRHLNVTEDISVWYREQCTYNPQGIIEVNKETKQGGTGLLSDLRQDRKRSYMQTHTNYPKNILEYKRDRNVGHPTQKPVALMEYLIKTYTNEGETVLDFTMGSGTTMLACQNLNRNGIGIELDKEYFEIAKQRIYANNK